MRGNPMDFYTFLKIILRKAKNEEMSLRD